VHKYSAIIDNASVECTYKWLYNPRTPDIWLTMTWMAPNMHFFHCHSESWNTLWNILCW